MILGTREEELVEGKISRLSLGPQTPGDHLPR